MVAEYGARGIRILRASVIRSRNYSVRGSNPIDEFAVRCRIPLKGRVVAVSASRSAAPMVECISRLSIRR